MKAILKNGMTKPLRGADISEIAVSVFNDALVIVMHDGDVIIAKSIHSDNP